MTTIKKDKGIKTLVDKTRAIVKKRDDEIQLLKRELKTAKGEKAVIFKMPDTMEVSNFPEVMKVRVENPTPAPEIQKVNVLNFKDIKIPEQKDIKFPEVQDVRLVNPTETNDKSATWTSSVIVAAVKGMSDLWVTLWNRGMTVKLDAEERLKPMPVIIVDHRGKPVNMTANANASVFPMVMRSGGGGSQNILDPYQIADQDVATTTKYYGYTDKDGNWYIMKNDTVANTYRYARGYPSSPYTTNWTNRASLTYTYFDVVF